MNAFANDDPELASLLTADDRDRLETAVLLASLRDAGPMPASVRKRVDKTARAMVARRAREHAEARPLSPLTSASSTTAAGSHVVETHASVEPESPRPRSTIVTWSGWAFAAAVLFALGLREVRPPAMQASAGASQTPTPHTNAMQRFDLAAEAGTVAFDRVTGIGSITLAPRSHDSRAAHDLDAQSAGVYEAWVQFAGDEQPRLVAAASAPLAHLNFGPICSPARGGDAPCAPIHSVIVSREPSVRAAAPRAESVVARGGAGEDQP